MKQNYVYLLLNFLTFIFPFIFSFYPKANFSKKWKYLWVAILIPAIIFIAWDEAFTRRGVWGFNENYLTGIFIGSLPIEELLFFVCIPYACVFTYEALNHFIEKDILWSIEKPISAAVVLVSVLVAVLNHERWYTFYTFLLLGLFLLIIRLKFKVRLGRFFLAYAILLIPFLIVNGVLTGSWIDNPIVWYNDDETVGIRIGTIPLEDFSYSMLLMLMNVWIFESLKMAMAPASSAQQAK